MKYNIETCSEKDSRFILDSLVAYNMEQVPEQPGRSPLDLSRKLTDESGKITAGILAGMYAWGCVYVDILWVDREHRREGLGSLLLEEVERTARANGGKLIHLDTFDFQARDFYIRHGFEEFGCLEGCPEGHCRYFLKKVLA